MRLVNLVPLSRALFGTLLGLIASCRTASTRIGAAAFTELPEPSPGERAGIWLPDDGVIVHVAGRCQGTYVRRECVIELTDLSNTDAGPQLLFRESLGQTLPTFSVDSDRFVLVLVGEDGRGAWRQMLRCDPARKTFQWSRRRYDDGM